MISFSRLGQVGRLGNQLFQVAFLTAFAKKFNVSYALPYWKYAPFFSHSFAFRDDLENVKFDLVVREPSLGFNEHYFAALVPLIKKSNVNIVTGYFQNHKYFTKAHILKIFQFKKDFAVNPDRCVAISVRRGDFVTHRDFNNIEGSVFRRELKKFKGFKVFVFSDDYHYCRNEFIGSEFEFLDGFDEIQQLQLMSKFEYFILSNSTFSYWGPMLNPSPKCVLYPKFMFPDRQRCALYNSEYWPKGHAYSPYINPINKRI